MGAELIKLSRVIYSLESQTEINFDQLMETIDILTPVVEGLTLRKRLFLEALTDMSR